MSDATELIWTCNVCNKPVADEIGYLHVSYRDIDEYQKWQDEFERTQAEKALKVITMAEMLAGPPAARWMVHHRACDPDPHTSDYWIGTERARNASQILDWTLHLSQKHWYSNTNWISFVRSALHSNNASVFA